MLLYCKDQSQPTACASKLVVLVGMETSVDLGYGDFKAISLRTFGLGDVYPVAAAPLYDVSSFLQAAGCLSKAK